MKGKVLALCIAVLFLLLVLSGCIDNNDNSKPAIDVNKFIGKWDIEYIEYFKQMNNNINYSLEVKSNGRFELINTANITVIENGTWIFFRDLLDFKDDYSYTSLMNGVWDYVFLEDNNITLTLTYYEKDPETGEVFLKLGLNKLDL